MGELDISLLLRQLRLKPEDTEEMEQELLEMYREWCRERGMGPSGDPPESFLSLVESDE